MIVAKGNVAISEATGWGRKRKQDQASVTVVLTAIKSGTSWTGGAEVEVGYKVVWRGGELHNLNSSNYMRFVVDV